jgi:hypothetical protein
LTSALGIAWITAASVSQITRQLGGERIGSVPDPPDVRGVVSRGRAPG